IALTLLRFLAVFIMVGTVLVAMFQEPYDPAYTTATPPYIQPQDMFNMKGFGQIFSVSLFAYLCHHSAPGLIKSMGDKQKANSIFASAFVTIAVIYIVLGAVCSLYFGTEMNPIATLNWIDYTGERPDGTPCPWWARVLSYTVVLFPCCDLLSVFPLNGVTLGNNLTSIVYGPDTKLTSRTVKKWRIIATVPPLICSYLIRDITTLTEICGLFGFVLVFFGPAALVIMSRNKCEKIWGKGPGVLTRFDGPLTENRVVFGFVGVAVACFVASVYFLFIAV
ncbi:hypothetical protein KIPB_009640, partial [Kipferlia bialata]